MNRSVERCVFAGLVRQHCIFLEAPPRVVGIALEDNVGAKSEVVRNIAPIPIDGGRDLGDTSFFERAAITFRPYRFRQAQSEWLAESRDHSTAAANPSRCTLPSFRCPTWFRQQRS